MRGRNRRGPNPLTRSYESNGPDVKVRGTAQHIAEKYTQLARDAHLSGDPVAAESYLQHAEHYYRLIQSAVQAQQAAINGMADDREDEDDDFDPASDRFTFRSPQAMPQNNPAGHFGSNGDRGSGEYQPLENGEGEAGEAAQPIAQPMPQRHSGEGGGFQSHRGRDERRGGRDQNRDRDRDGNRDRDRGADRDRNADRFRGAERFTPPPRRPPPEVLGTGEQPELPAFLTSPVRPVLIEPELPVVEAPVQSEEAVSVGPLRARRRRRVRPVDGTVAIDGGENDV
ncbi:Domain of unknown function DUF4167 [Rhabdaerophilaceae bacterium]